MDVTSNVSSWRLALQPRFQPVAAPAAVFGGSLACYLVLRYALLSSVTGSAATCLIADAGAVTIAVLLLNIRYADIPDFLHPLMRGIGAVVLVQVAFDNAALLYGPASVINGQRGWFFVTGGLAALAAGIGGMVRPSLLLPLFAHYVAFRHQLNAVTGVEVSETDYLSMLDIAEFVTTGGLIIALTDRYLPLNGRASPDTASASHRAAALVLACAIGAHFGNYFISGWTKVRTGGGDPFFWLLNNPTQTSILIGLERGDNPLAAWPLLVQFSWNAISWAVLPLNLFVLGTQITAPLALLGRRSIMLYTLLFDVFHVAVYLTLGAAFFFWVAVNALIFASARRLPRDAFSPSVRLVAAAAVALAHFGFYTSHLGWLDGAKLASPSIVADTVDGRTVPVPSVYFGILSYSIAQTAMYIPDGHFPMRLGGNTYNRADWHDAQTCGPQTRAHQDTGVGLATVERMIRQTDAAMRRDPLVKDWNLYYLYPHHMVANPLLFRSFNALSMNDIVGYRYIVDSVCLNLRNGRLQRDVRKHSEFRIDVRR